MQPAVGVEAHRAAAPDVAGAAQALLAVGRDVSRVLRACEFATGFQDLAHGALRSGSEAAQSATWTAAPADGKSSPNPGREATGTRRNCTARARPRSSRSEAGRISRNVTTPPTC